MLIKYFTNENISSAAFLIVYLPLLNFLSLIFMARYFGKRGSVFLTFFNICLMFLMSIFFFLRMIASENFFSIHFNFGSWVVANLAIANWSFTFDSLSLSMSIVVCSISFLVHLYSFNYMSNDPNFVKFLSYLSLFTFFMLVLIFSSNLIIFFLGWEGVGLCSYLLIGFWNTRVQAGKSALKALFMNRIGDFFLLIAVCIILRYFKTTDISVILGLAPYFKNIVYDSFFFKMGLIDLISIFLFLGAVGKSAQIGLHTWLPDAMEGPTPVSALIHAATMVTAGIFLVIRLSYLIDFSEKTLILMVIFGTLTSLYSGLIALGQWDLKKIIAFSTCSQLGYMLVMCGLSSYTLSFYHLSTHAFFKALLFLSAGYVIHLFSGEQDIRKMGSLIHVSSFSYIFLLVGSLSLMGFLFLSGFYSKEMIIHLFSLKSEIRITFWIFYFFLIFSVFLTLLYSFKIIYYVYFIENNFLNKKSFKLIYDKIFGSQWMVFAITILGFATVFFGYIVKNIYLPGSNFFVNSVFYSFRDFSNYSEFIFFDYDIFFLFTIFVSFNVLIFIFKYPNEGAATFDNFFTIKKFGDFKNQKNNNFSSDYKESIKYTYYTEVIILRILNSKLYFDIIYNFLAKKFYKVLYVLFEILEKGLFDLFGPSGLSFCVYYLARATSRFHSGYIHHYANVMLLSVMFFLLLFFF